MVQMAPPLMAISIDPKTASEIPSLAVASGIWVAQAPYTAPLTKNMAAAASQRPRAFSVPVEGLSIRARVL